MPPKKPIDKAEQKRREQAAADKTFGLKNKNKSKAVQNYIKQVNQSVRHANNQDQKDAEKKQKKADVAAKQQQALLLGLAGSLKEARTMAKGKKAAKKDGASASTQAPKEKVETPEERKAKEEAVMKVFQKFHQYTKDKLYDMKNGDTATFNRKRQQDTVFKLLTDNQIQKLASKVLYMKFPDEEEDDDEEEMPIEELIEQERAALIPGEGTPVTEETLKQWIEKKEEERKAKEEEERKKRAAAGKTVQSGRELFAFDPSLFIDEEGADDTKYEKKGLYSDDEDGEGDDDDDDDSDDDVDEVTDKMNGASIGNKDVFLKGEDVNLDEL